MIRIKRFYNVTYPLEKNVPDYTSKVNGVKLSYLSCSGGYSVKLRVVVIVTH